MQIGIKNFTAQEAAHYFDDLARLRIEVFRDYPYLYDGDMDYERSYLQTYLDAPASVVVIAFDEDRVIGASTGLPMACEPLYIRQALLNGGYDPNKIFYFGESVLQKKYRGQGIGVAFFQHREAYARQLGGFTHLTFCSVMRPPDHPLRPPDYVPLDNFWQKRGFQPTDMLCYMLWKDVDQLHETGKPLRFWIKPIEAI